MSCKITKLPEGSGKSCDVCQKEIVSQALVRISYSDTSTEAIFIACGNCLRNMHNAVSNDLPHGVTIALPVRSI